MYSKDVTIYVHGMKVVINVCCNPNTPDSILKSKAIKLYLKELENKLYQGNGIQ